METRMIRIVCGTDSVRSTIQDMTASAFPPRVGPRIPKTTAIRVLDNEQMIPTQMLRLRPFTVLVSISRPTQSVPKRCVRLGG